MYTYTFKVNRVSPNLHRGHSNLHECLQTYTGIPPKLYRITSQLILGCLPSYCNKMKQYTYLSFVVVVDVIVIFGLIRIQ